ncbi:MAG: molybdopterin-binding protein, partial [Thermodesulfobacteriota bacterium]|nr:molybdopterin-binding protein [Thermodesulfobacteriota bacterium]
MLKKLKIKDSIGMILAHDITKVIPGEFKGAAFKKGHIIREEDIPEFLDIGKEHVYVLELTEDNMHEDDAGLAIANAISGNGITLSAPSEGKVNLSASYKGLLKIKTSLLEMINSLGEVIVSTIHNNTICNPPLIVAGTRIIPLFIEKSKIEKVKELCEKEGKLIEILPFKEKKVGVIITGNEVYTGRIEDKFGDIIQNKVEALGSRITKRIITPDHAKIISGSILELQSLGTDVIIVCSGLSVDPDDVTYEGVEKSGAAIISYGAPVLPGSMF